MNEWLIVLQAISISLVLTILIELGIWKVLCSFFKGYNFEYLWASIIVINFVTNPAINLASWILNPSREFLLLEIILEILVILIESVILYIIYRKSFYKLLLLSIVINLFSYGIGLILFSFF